ncbi:MAG TPA: SusC/RagA family TonB-linked outer membrane protein, partial [Niastella sp.]|nr:SusC/RagA family TonB-linked outer membrane protein [Niastella sp.]
MRKVLWLLGGLLCYASQMQAQNRTIKGKVSDENGHPLPNASITLKGAIQGSTSNADGTYTLTIPATSKAIVISSVGMVSQEFRLGGSSVINAVLQSQLGILGEVVIVAYGTQKRAALTGAVASIRSPDIENKPFTSIDKILQGQIPGLQSVANSGQPGANQSILIRGMSSITASNAPMWVIDGIIINFGEVSRLATTSNLLSTLNPNDIENITVLKDAAAGSLYGSRAANGVILVTTKKGKAGKTRLRFDTEIGQNSIAYENDRYKPLNADQYFELTREGLLNAGRSEDSAAKVLKGLGYGNGIDFNWYDAIQNKSGKQQQFNLSAEGGNDKTTVYLSAGYFTQEGTTINSKLNRTSGSARLTHKASDKLTLNFNITGGYVDQRAPATGGNFNNPVLAAIMQSPAATAYNKDGSYNFTNLGSIYNVIALTEMDKRFLREIGLRGNMNAEYKILDNLKFRTSVSGDLNIVEEEQYNNPLHGDGVALTGRSYYYYNRYFNRLWTNTIDYRQLLSKAWNTTLNFQLGYEAQKSSGNLSSVQAQVLPVSPSITWPGAGASPVTASALPSDYSFVSQFSTASININDKYIVSGSFRRDGSSKFGAKNKYGNFWSVGSSWNMDKESFIENLGFISQLKLRASYGVNGNSGIGNYDWYRLYSYGNNYNALSGSAPSNVGDSNLTWELNRSFNIGADIGVLQNRIQLSVDVYNRRSEELLLDVPLSLTSGYQRALRNVGTMQNAGI